MARKLGRLPRELILFGIEGGDFSAGVGLTTDVEAALDRVVEDVSMLTAIRETVH
jgi:hypothetical protein